MVPNSPTLPPQGIRPRASGGGGGTQEGGNTFFALDACLDRKPGKYKEKWLFFLPRQRKK